MYRTKTKSDAERWIHVSPLLGEGETPCAHAGRISIRPKCCAQCQLPRRSNANAPPAAPPTATPCMMTFPVFIDFCSLPSSLPPRRSSPSRIEVCGPEPAGGSPIVPHASCMSVLRYWAYHCCSVSPSGHSCDCSHMAWNLPTAGPAACVMLPAMSVMLPAMSTTADPFAAACFAAGCFAVCFGSATR